MLDCKGQESAPFELLIAVVLMGFVLFMGMQAMDTLAKEKCLSEAESELNEFKTNLESVVVKHDAVNFSFDFPPCGKGEEIELQVSNNERYCSSHCGGTRTSCTLLRYSAEGISVAPKCVNIPEFTEFKETASGICEQPGYNAINLKQTGVPKGHYVLRYNSSSSGYPEVCVFLKD